MRLYVCRAYTYHWASCLCATRTICHCQSISLDSGHGPGFTDCHDRWYSSARAYPREPRASAFTLGKGSKSVCLGSTHRDVENRGLEAPRNGPRNLRLFSSRGWAQGRICVFPTRVCATQCLCAMTPTPQSARREVQVNDRTIATNASSLES